MHRKLLAVFAVALTTFLLVGAITLLPALASPRAALVTNGPIVYVDDDTCPAVGSGTDVDPYCRIQDGVDAVADGGAVLVAAGTYTGTELVVDSRTGYTYTQVVFITRSVTLRGGYDAGDWSAGSNPAINATTIDACRAGRGISIVGVDGDEPAVSLDGLTITGGDYTGLRNVYDSPFDVGGGIYAYRGGLTVRNCVVSDNVASRTSDGRGGGIYVERAYGDPGTVVESTVVLSNSALGDTGKGGGLYLLRSNPISISRTTFQDNTASYCCGGAMLESFYAPLTIVETDFLGNTAGSNGRCGGYIELRAGAALSMDRVRFLGNRNEQGEAVLNIQANAPGTAIPPARLTNLVFADNRADSTHAHNALMSINSTGSGNETEFSLAHVTAADNQVPTFVYGSSAGSNHTLRVSLTNTLMVSLTHGFVGYELSDNGVEIRHTNTLTDNVTTLHHVEDGSPTFTAVNAMGGHASLDCTYHLRPDSDAIDAGVDAGVTVDIDGDSRPIYDGYDIGADEFVVYRVYLPLVNRVALQPST